MTARTYSLLWKYIVKTFHWLIVPGIYRVDLYKPFKYNILAKTPFAWCIKLFIKNKHCSHKHNLICYTLAEVAELADALGSGPNVRKDVGVRIPASAFAQSFSIKDLRPKTNQN